MENIKQTVAEEIAKRLRYIRVNDWLGDDG